MVRALKVAVQMDPMDSIDINGNSDFALMLAAQARGHALWHYEVRHMSLGEGRAGARLTAKARPVTVQRVHGAHFSFGAETTLDLATMDVVMRKAAPKLGLKLVNFRK